MAIKTYSIKKGFVKGVVGVLTAGLTLLSFTQFADVSIWSLVEQYVKPIIGSLTVAGLFTLILNWVKFRYYK